MKERLGTITSSLVEIPITFNDKCNAAVQLDTATEYFDPTSSENLNSNSSTLGPWVTHPDRKTDVTASISSFPMSGLVIGKFKSLGGN
jgi:hypothetical protein